jgi:hypothetical protein
VIVDYNTVANIRQFVGNLFWVAIDVNTAAGGEILTLFDVAINPPGGSQFNFTGSTNIGAVSNNGNGFADWTLRAVDLSRFASTAIVTFHATWNTASAGGESFFLIPVTCVGTQCFPTVSEPSALILFGSGLVFVSIAYRRFSLEK